MTEQFKGVATNVSKEIKRVLREQGKTQRWLADALNIDEKTFSGKLVRNSITAEELLQIGGVLRMDLNKMKSAFNSSPERKVENLLGVDVFEYTDWKGIDSRQIQYNDVRFLIDSMKKYDGCTVLLKMSGYMKIYKEFKHKSLWCGFVNTIPELHIES